MMSSAGVQIVPEDQRESENSWGDDVTTVYQREVTAHHKTPVFRMEFGLAASPLGGLAGAEAILRLIIQII